MKLVGMVPTAATFISWVLAAVTICRDRAA